MVNFDVLVKLLVCTKSWPSHCATKWSKFRIQVSSKQIYQNFSKFVNRLVCTKCTASDLPELIAPPGGQNFAWLFFQNYYTKTFQSMSIASFAPRALTLTFQNSLHHQWSKLRIQYSSKQLHQNFSKYVNRFVCTKGTASDLPKLIAPPSGQNFAFKFLQNDFTQTFQS